jgi:1-aminocyclopropane-1-carboxylate synthase
MKTRILSIFHSEPLSSPVFYGRLRFARSTQVPVQSNSCRSFKCSSTSMKEPSPTYDPKFSAPRAGAAVSLLPTYLADARAIEKYTASTPEGVLQLSVAENQLLEDLLLPALTEFSSTQIFPADAIYYQPTHGRETLRKAAAVYLRDLLELEHSLDPDGIVVGAGCNAVLENLCITLAEPGQGVMIPLPYYAAFDFDLGSRAGLKVVPVPTMEHSGVKYLDSRASVPVGAYYPTRGALDSALHKSIKEKGIEPRILLLSHPQNPLGICYPPHVIQECIDWCRSNKVHLVSDEIYAGSVYRKEDASFTSVLKVATSASSPLESLGLGPYVHFVYALSKDFALSGLRVGLLYSENSEIRLPLQKLNDLCCVSSQTQLLVQRMLTERGKSGLPWTQDFLQKNHERLRQRGDVWQSCLEELAIPYLPATAGLFSWMDFSEFLPSLGSPFERERALYLELLNEYGLLFTPGTSMHNEHPGFFRCVFTAASEEEFVFGMERLRKFVAAKRKSG